MHMNSAPHLLAEDRPDFERVLDQALRAANHDPELAAAIGRRLTNQQLRTMAVSAITAISACASAEYATYVSAREELRAHPPVAHPPTERRRPPPPCTTTAPTRRARAPVRCSPCWRRSWPESPLSSFCSSAM
ncbi:hypothetical protein GCM10020000_39820 [Streptomyces olivoverticillatus]